MVVVGTGGKGEKRDEEGEVVSLTRSIKRTRDNNAPDKSLFLKSMCSILFNILRLGIMRLDWCVPGAVLVIGLAAELASNQSNVRDRM